MSLLTVGILREVFNYLFLLSCQIKTGKSPAAQFFFFPLPPNDWVSPPTHTLHVIISPYAGNTNTCGKGLIICFCRLCPVSPHPRFFHKITQRGNIVPHSHVLSSHTQRTRRTFSPVFLMRSSLDGFEAPIWVPWVGVTYSDGKETGSELFSQGLVANWVDWKFVFKSWGHWALICFVLMFFFFIFLKKILMAIVSQHNWKIV